jgi:hypothetical protein
MVVPVLAGLLMLGAGCTRSSGPQEIAGPPTTSAGEVPASASVTPLCPEDVPVVDLTMRDESELPVRVLNAPVWLASAHRLRRAHGAGVSGCGR